jgi:4'-phosphopantetheinyl transferase
MGSPAQTEVQVWWSSLLSADRSLLGFLDPSERARVDALQRSADQGRSIVAAALLRVAVGAHLGVRPAEVAVDRTCDDCGRPHGRPRIDGPGGRAPQVSVSHSGLLVVVALTEVVPLGIDVQRIDDLGRRGGGSSQHDAEEWARREAVLKAGCGVERATVRSLRAPLAGYAAALATAHRPPVGPEVQVRHWPEVSAA